MEISSWVKPQEHLLLSVSLPLAEYISVKNVGIPAEISQELKVDFIMGWPIWTQLQEYVRTQVWINEKIVYYKDMEDDARAHIVGSDSPNRVSGNKFYLHIKHPKQILLLGLEPRPRVIVHGKSEKLSIVKYLSAPISPSDVKVLVEVTCWGGRHEEAHRHRD